MIDSILSKIKIANTAINEGSDVVKSDINQFGQMVNAELQYEFIPETTNFVQKSCLGGNCIIKTTMLNMI